MYTVTPQNDAQTQSLQFMKHLDAYDFWTEVRRPGHATAVMVAPKEQANFKLFLQDYKIKYETLIDNVQT